MRADMGRYGGGKENYTDVPAARVRMFRSLQLAGEGRWSPLSSYIYLQTSCTPQTSCHSGSQLVSKRVISAPRL
jgi:hypothetical protein